MGVVGDFVEEEEKKVRVRCGKSAGEEEKLGRGGRGISTASGESRVFRKLPIYLHEVVHTVFTFWNDIFMVADLFVHTAASNISVVKEIEGVVDPGIFNVVRFASAAIPFVPFVLRANDSQTRNTGMELGFWVSLGYLMQAIGLLTSDAGRASFLSMLTIVVVPLLDGMLGSIIPARTWFGALMSIFGVVMLESSGSPPCVGDLLNFLSALFFGVHMLRTEHISRRTSKENFIPLLGYEMLVVALVSTLWYFIGGSFFGTLALNPTDWTWSTFWSSALSFPWIPALYTGLFSTGLCLWIEVHFSVCLKRYSLRWIYWNSSLLWSKWFLTLKYTFHYIKGGSFPTDWAKNEWKRLRER
ncbi:hypothetical protein MTR67_022770 [Solanum verrucosum]|uniref:EamA domain-containing protein n=1 Tax=Solanum verrucosum TaxID=315347 RepID=A0AAF0QYG6_SOLVR|nr:hypothetical protein MTR67_022770 [Solanum verrucosum]